MTLTLQDVSIVVVARNNAPGALNPDYLRAAGVVGPDWALSPDAAPMSTEVMSQVRYANGVALVATPDRITVQQTVLAGGAEPFAAVSADLVAEVIRRYVGALPFLQITAIGVNFVGYQFAPGGRSPGAYLSEQFIVDGPWKVVNGFPARPSVRFAYPWWAGGTLTLTLDEGTFALQGTPPQPVLVVTANLHRDVAAADGAGVLAPAGVSQVLPLLDGAARDVPQVLSVVAESVLLSSVAVR